MLRGLSLFANIGVAEARLVDLDVDICLANEIEPKRAAIYEHLYPRTTMVCGDITKKKIRNKIISLAKELDVNFVMATPPCQGMSVAGNRNPIDARNQLIYYAIEIIKQLSPDFILLENVPRQLKTHILVEQKTMLIPEYIERQLGASYAFNDQKLINAKYYKVPQNR